MRLIDAAIFFPVALALAQSPGNPPALGVCSIPLLEMRPPANGHFTIATITPPADPKNFPMPSLKPPAPPCPAASSLPAPTPPAAPEAPQAPAPPPAPVPPEPPPAK